MRASRLHSYCTWLLGNLEAPTLERAWTLSEAGGVLLTAHAPQGPTVGGNVNALETRVSSENLNLNNVNVNLSLNLNQFILDPLRKIKSQVLPPSGSHSARGLWPTGFSPMCLIASFAVKDFETLVWSNVFTR